MTCTCDGGIGMHSIHCATRQLTTTHKAGDDVHMTTRELVLESKSQPDKTPVLSAHRGGASVMITPELDEDYWEFRVVLSPRQAVVGFPKFGTIGIGFAVEEADWNTNLPFTCEAEHIARHIAVNKGDADIDDADVIAAIRLIQEAATAAGRW